MTNYTTSVKRYIGFIKGSDVDIILRIEYVTTEAALLADADFETMNDAILKWSSLNY